VQLGLAWTALELASVSVRSGDCLSAFVYLVKGSNSWVGYVQGINGVMQVHTIADNCCTGCLRVSRVQLQHMVFYHRFSSHDAVVASQMLTALPAGAQNS